MLHILISAMPDLLDSLPSEPPLPALDPPPHPTSSSNGGHSSSKTVADSQATFTATSGDGISTRKTRSFAKEMPSAKQQHAESRRLLQQAEVWQNNPKHAAVQQARQKLPAFAQRQQVLAKLKQNSVVVISGATGTVSAVLLHAFDLLFCIPALTP